MQSVYINIFNVYAFANVSLAKCSVSLLTMALQLHDFSWGTKSLDVQQTDLGIVRSSGKDSVEVILPTSQTDIGKFSHLPCIFLNIFYRRGIR